MSAIDTPNVKNCHHCSIDAHIWHKFPLYFPTHNCAIDFHIMSRTTTIMPGCTLLLVRTIVQCVQVICQELEPSCQDLNCAMGAHRSAIDAHNMQRITTIILELALYWAWRTSTAMNAHNMPRTAIMSGGTKHTPPPPPPHKNTKTRSPLTQKKQTKKIKNKNQKVN